MTSINPNEDAYLNLLQDVLENGEQQIDRTGVGTLSVFGRTLRYDLTEGFPLFTTKKVYFKGVSSELLWFLEGSGDERRLAEILHGKPREEIEDKTTVWTKNANAPYWVDHARYPGDLGRVYGVQFRYWQAPHGETIDQIKRVVDGIKREPYGRRHIVNAWNPGELHLMALPPCHGPAQFKVVNGKLNCSIVLRK